MPNAPRKKCENCHSLNHLTYACKKIDVCVSKEPELFYDPSVPLRRRDYPFCVNIDCMQCKIYVISSYFNLRRKFIYGCIS